MKAFDDIDASGLTNPRFRDGTNRNKVIAFDLSAMTGLANPTLLCDNRGIGDGGISRSEITITTTGTINDLNIGSGISVATLVRMNNASAATITGIQGGSAGKQIVISNVGSSLVLLAHQNAGSLAANRLQNIAASASTPLAPGGSAIYQYETAGNFWRLVAHEQGAWITPTFAAGNFTGNGAMTWTVIAGNVTTSRYRLSGRTLTTGQEIVNTTVGGTLNTNLQIGNGQWGGFTVASSVLNQCLILDNGVWFSGYGQVVIAVSTTQILYSKVGAANFAASTTSTQIYSEITFEVN